MKNNGNNIEAINRIRKAVDLDWYFPIEEYWPLLDDLLQKKTTSEVEYFYSGKYTGKTTFIIKTIVILTLTFPFLDSVIIRKYKEDHKNTTRNMFRSAVQELDNGFFKHYGIKTNFYNSFKFSTDDDFVYLPTGQRIYFIGSNDAGRSASASSLSKDRIVGIRFWEEPNEVNDLKDIDNKDLERDEILKSNFDNLEDTWGRPDKTQIERFGWEPKTIIASNGWNIKDTFLWDKFLEKAFPWNHPDLYWHLEQELCLVRTIKGYVRVFYPHWKLPIKYGLISDNKIKSRLKEKINDPENYDLFYLAKPTGLKEKIFSRAEHQIPIYDYDKKYFNSKANVKLIGYGFDFGYLRDTSVLVGLFWDRFRKKFIVKNLWYIQSSFVKIQVKGSKNQIGMVDFLLDAASDPSNNTRKKIMIKYDKPHDAVLVEALKDEMKRREVDHMFSFVPIFPKNSNRYNISKRIQMWMRIIKNGLIEFDNSAWRVRKELLSMVIEGDELKGYKRNEKKPLDFTNALEYIIMEAFTDYKLGVLDKRLRD